jgi:hypothetical protein
LRNPAADRADPEQNDGRTGETSGPRPSHRKIAAATTSPLRLEECVGAFDIDHMTFGDFQETQRRSPGEIELTTDKEERHLASNHLTVTLR